ncbi:MAG: hypothetical protein HY553_08950 [Elusimicrobia bacterium]|nr:hypothetical protein [Elusimicrobiota bacterium]
MALNAVSLPLVALRALEPPPEDALGMVRHASVRTEDLLEVGIDPSLGALCR